VLKYEGRRKMTRGLAKFIMSLYYDVVDQGTIEKDMKATRERRKQEKKKGISLIEVLITIFILAAVCITLVSVFIYGFNLLARTKQTAVATQVAQFEVERYRNMEFDLIPIQAATTATFTDLYGEDAESPYRFLFNSTNEGYLRNGQETITIEDGAAINMDADIKKMTITIVWDYRTRTIAGGDPMRKDVVTYFTREGINRR
jgi:type II secretory pathway pseudopilin PulG